MSDSPCLTAPQTQSTFSTVIPRRPQAKTELRVCCLLFIGVLGVPFEGPRAAWACGSGIYGFRSLLIEFLSSLSHSESSCVSPTISYHPLLSPRALIHMLHWLSMGSRFASGGDAARHPFPLSFPWTPVGASSSTRTGSGPFVFEPGRVAARC